MASESFDHLPGPRRHRNECRGHTFFHQRIPREGDQAYVEMGFPGLEAKHPDRHALWLACGSWGGDQLAVYQRIREEEGMVYTVYMYPQLYSDCGLIETHFSTESEKAETVILHIAEELERMKEEGLVEGSWRGPNAG